MSASRVVILYKALTSVGKTEAESDTADIVSRIGLSPRGKGIAL